MSEETASRQEKIVASIVEVLGDEIFPTQHLPTKIRLLKEERDQLRDYIFKRQL
jgi:hypothetical protein